MSRELVPAGVGQSLEYLHSLSFGCQTNSPKPLSLCGWPLQLSGRGAAVRPYGCGISDGSRYSTSTRAPAPLTGGRSSLFVPLNFVLMYFKIEERAVS